MYENTWEIGVCNRGKDRNQDLIFLIENEEQQTFIGVGVNVESICSRSTLFA